MGVGRERRPSSTTRSCSRTGRSRCSTTAAGRRRSTTPGRIRVSVNQSSKTASLVRRVRPLPGVSTPTSRATSQVLPNGDVFVGWGQQPYFTEFNASGQQIFDARFTLRTPRATGPTGSPGAGSRPRAPSIAARAEQRRHDRGVGELERRHHGVLVARAGRSEPRSLADAADRRAQGRVRDRDRGVDRHARTSPCRRWVSRARCSATSAGLGRRLRIGIVRAQRVRVLESGAGGLPAVCFSRAPATSRSTITAGPHGDRQDRHGADPGPGRRELLYFTLTGAGRSMLAHARGRPAAWST